MKRYIMFSANYLPNLGGVERYTYNLAKKLIEKGHKVTVVTSNVNKSINYSISEGIEIYRVPCFNLLKGRFPVLKINREFFSLLKGLKRKKYDMCIVNTRFYVHSLFGAIFGKINSNKVIVIEHGTNHFTVNNKSLDFLGHIYEHCITYIIKMFCRDYYGVSIACNDWLNHYNIMAKSTLHNAIDIKEINNILNNTNVNYKKEYNLCEDSIIITYTGRLVKEKGILKLIEAVEEINKVNKNVYLFVAGDGDLMEDVKNSSNRNIKVLGKLNFNKVISLLKQTDIFCLPTEYPEGFPTSVIEAAACKCFIITTSAGGSKELVLNNEYGIILEDNSVGELIQQLKNSISNSSYRKKAKEATYKRCIEKFTWDIIAKKVEEL
ncbi:glycosyltransferase family 4 protein [Clostridium butyricum]|uniref:glycosyltransferase family 4 protein n=1 Tax=Clostridium butyricum TaxID=1492 RepID=UPI0018ABAEB0|nr:glycosyltransferase family 4 protein [Clostridium butyricum]